MDGVKNSLMRFDSVGRDLLKLLNDGNFLGTMVSFFSNIVSFPDLLRCPDSTP